MDLAAPHSGFVIAAYILSAALIAVYSGFAPRLLDGGQVGETIYMIGGFALLGLAFGQSSGAVNSRRNGWRSG